MVYTGPEVQSWHEAVDWSRIGGAGAGHTWAWCHATTGIAGEGEGFRSSWSAMPQVGLVRGAIHVLSPWYAGRAQARHFVSTIGDPRGALTAVAFQPDGHRVSDPLPAVEVLEDFATEYELLTSGHPLVVRTQWRWWAPHDPHGLGARISPYLWHADSSWAQRWGREGVPRWSAYGGWPAPTFWLAHRMGVPGIAGRCGVSMFTGDLAALSVLLGLEPLGPELDAPAAARRPRWLPTFRLGRSARRRS